MGREDVDVAHVQVATETAAPVDVDITAPVVLTSSEPYLNGVFVFEGTVGGMPVYFNYAVNRKLHRIDHYWAVADDERPLGHHNGQCGSEHIAGWRRSRIPS